MKKIFIALAAVLTVGVLGAGAVSAQDNMATGSDVTLAKEQVMEASYYAAGESVIINGVVQGDLYCAGGSVEVNGTIEGDVLCAAQDLRIGGTVTGNVRSVGQNVAISGEVGQSVTLAGQVLDISGNVERDATLTGQSVRVSGKIGRDAVVGSERLVVSGEVGRNIQAASEGVALRDEAVVGGNITYTSNNDAVVDEGAAISGELVREDPPRNEAHNVGPFAWVAGALFAFAVLIPIGVAFIALAPRATNGAVEAVRHKLLVVIGLGLLGLFLTPILAIAIMVSVIGLPLGIMLFIAWGLSLLLAFVVGAYTVGAWVTAVDTDHSPMRKLLALVLGLAVFIGFSFLPYVGWVITLMALVAGLGVIMLGLGRAIRFQYTKPASAKKKTEK